MSEDEPEPPAGGQGLTPVAQNRLAARVRVSNEMESSAPRMRLRVNKHLDFTEPAAAHKINKAKQQMRAVLKKKSISAAAAGLAIKQALDVATNYQIEAVRLKQANQGRARAGENLRVLMGHIRRLSRAMAELSPVSKGKLSLLIVAKNWTEFDAEMFAELLYEMLDSLSQLSPKRFADEASLEIRECLAYSPDTTVTSYDRWETAPRSELWECLPAATRSKVEEEFRAWRPPTKAQATAFFDRLESLLERHSKRRPGPPTAPVGPYLASIRAIWRQLNLKVGEARGESSGKRAESSIQQFANLALRGVGDDTIITIRQIRKLKVKETKRRVK